MNNSRLSFFSRFIRTFLDGGYLYEQTRMFGKQTLFEINYFISKTFTLLNIDKDGLNMISRTIENLYQKYIASYLRHSLT